MQAITGPFLQEQLIHKRRGTDLFSILSQPAFFFCIYSYMWSFHHPVFFFDTQATRSIYPEFACSLVFPFADPGREPLVFPSISIIHGKRLCDAICRLSIDIVFLFSEFVLSRFSFSLFVFERVLISDAFLTPQSARRENNIVVR